MAFHPDTHTHTINQTWLKTILLETRRQFIAMRSHSQALPHLPLSFSFGQTCGYSRAVPISTIQTEAQYTYQGEQIIMKICTFTLRQNAWASTFSSHVTTLKSVF